ncbi:conserved Plasmodium protein, unknown function [Plasmodium chabaudi adami]|uniref:Uncharacterized protein n=1 Tax=Plasmodium chabaudi adami TaxID=5826 RepID=A0A1C6YDN3_PLACE|nr:conserved Plasmodium protein, unknown function [Plasmodium chabaudi adami]
MECFLFDSFTLPTINTFIILDVIIKVLKKKEKGKWREGKKVLYLGNKILIDTFPPNYNFILNFLNVLIEDQNKTSDYINNNVCKNDDSCENKSVWDVKKVKDYKRGCVKETNYFNVKGNLHITMKELKNILKNIHIKYVDNEIHLSNLLYKLNKDKKYNLIIINLAFFYFKDKIKLNSFIQGMSHFTTNFTPTNKNNITNLGNTNSFNFSLTSKQTHIDSFLQKEICDDQFLKNIMNIHFQYSFFVNFFEHLNSVDNFFVLSKKKKSKNEWLAPQMNDTNIKNDKNEINNNITFSCSSSSSNNEQREDRIKEVDPLYYESNLINHNKLVSCRKRSYTENISINMGKKKMKKNLYIFDMFPKSESYKKMYMNMISLYFNYIYLIS